MGINKHRQPLDTVKLEKIWEREQTPFDRSDVLEDSVDLTVAIQAAANISGVGVTR